MPLNVTGPLSLGGTVVGQSIRLELGLSAFGVITLNDTNVRNLAAVPTGAINFGAFYGKSAVTPITATADTTARVYTQNQSAIAAFNPLTAANGTLPYTYLVSSGTLPAGLSLNSTTGAVTGSPTASYVAANVTFIVRDANNVQAATTSTVNFTVRAATTATAVTTARVFTNGQAAITAFNPLTAANGQTPYTYSIQSGTLPGGLSLNSSTGAVSGTPNANYAAANVVFRVQDVNGVVAATTSSVSFTVNAATTATADTTARSGQAGNAITAFNPLTASNGTTPYTYSVQSGTLPAGLSLNPSTGQVSGTPSAAVTVTVVFRVQDTNAVVAATTSSVNFTYTAAPVALSFLLVGGGGGGGGGNSTVHGSAGGGGGGGLRTGSLAAVPAGTVFTITVGAGGTGAPFTATAGGGAGGASSLTSPVASATPAGGGGGGGGTGPASGVFAAGAGSNLSSGGGGLSRNSFWPAPGTGFVGNAGGASGGAPGTAGGTAGGAPGMAPFPVGTARGGGGGGGGAGQSGGLGQPQIRTANTPQVGGTGGNGTTNTIQGPTVTYGGGGGGGNGGGQGASAGGTGGGGGPGAPLSSFATNPSGQTNTGGGGAGGGRTQGGGAGGSGVVIITVPTPQVSGIRTGINTTGTNGGVTWIRWTGPGTYTA
jgi:hypothetical protein